MNKTFAAFVAVATIASAFATTPASAQRGLGAAVAGGIIGGAIVGGAIASANRPVYVEGPPPRLRAAIGRGSASGMATAGRSAPFRSATDLT